VPGPDGGYIMSIASVYDGGSLRLDGKLTYDFLSPTDIDELQIRLNEVADMLHGRTGAGSECLGWLEPSRLVGSAETVRLKKAASRLKEETDCLVVIGIGGSYLGTAAVFEAICPDGVNPNILQYAGTNMSARYHTDLLASLENRRYGLNIISKSGTTTEPGIAFRLLRKELERRIGHELAGAQIVATTDHAKGALRKLADTEGWVSFDVPDDVGGRYSVLTPVGLFPLAYAGIDIDALVTGAIEASIACREKSPNRNPALMYAAMRHLLYKSGLQIEMLVSFEPRFAQLIEWWKQLFGESEGKDNTGLFPAGAIYSRDLHSIGQWVQDGPRILFETFLSVESGEPSLKVPSMGEGPCPDELDYLEGREFYEINQDAREATRVAHAEGRCPNIGLYMPKLDAHNLGVLIYTFEYACAISGYLNEINPFNQPGVEVYKHKMFELLGKPDNVH